MDGFMTPPKHVGFSAKKLFDENGSIIDGAIAYIEPSGGGPTEPHTHAHDHIFIVTQGEAIIEMGGETYIVKKDESFRVKGSLPHSVRNAADKVTVMIGISVK